MRWLSLLLLLALVLSGCVPADRSTPQPDPALETGSAPWWREAVFYEIFVRSFSDSDGDGIGDFKGILQKLDYIESLGVNAIWLMPIHPSPSYHGYDVLDYYDVNPEYGTMDDFIGEAHKRGMKIIIDLVINHTSSKHPFLSTPTARSIHNTGTGTYGRMCRAITGIRAITGFTTDSSVTACRT